MIKTTIKYKEERDLLNIICDSNIWYGIAAGREAIPEDGKFMATALSLFEIATSSNIVNIVEFQKLIGSIHANSGPIFPVNPFDYVIKNHDSSYNPDNKGIINVLIEFSKILAIENPEEVEFPQETEDQIKAKCQLERQASLNFADFGNSKADEIRKSINKGIGRKKHLEKDTTELTKEMFKSFIYDYLKDKDYEMDFSTFDWSQIELFLCVIDTYFKTLETTKNMKLHANDAVDILNMLYVTPGSKYYTHERNWRRYIQDDYRVAHYLYK